MQALGGNRADPACPVAGFRDPRVDDVHPGQRKFFQRGLHGAGKRGGDEVRRISNPRSCRRSGQSGPPWRRVRRPEIELRFLFFRRTRISSRARNLQDAPDLGCRSSFAQVRYAETIMQQAGITKIHLWATLPGAGEGSRARARALAHDKGGLDNLQITPRSVMRDTQRAPQLRTVSTPAAWQCASNDQEPSRSCPSGHWKSGDGCHAPESRET